MKNLLYLCGIFKLKETMIYKFNRKTLTYNNVTVQVGIIVLVITMILSFTIFKLIDSVEYISEETRTIIIKEQNQFSKEKLKEYLLELNVKYPNIVMAQAEIETGDFTSHIFKENNNLFGMKVARQRPSTNKGEENGHAYYSSWKESVVDYAFYSATFLNKIHTEDEYLNYLRQHYAEDTTYVSKILQKIR